MEKQVELKNFMAEMYADSDDTLRNLGELAKMLLKLNKGEKLSKEDVEYLGYLINDAEDAHKFDYFCDETDYLKK